MSTEDVAVTAVAAGGDGIARLSEGRVCFVEGALPGERVAVAVTQRRRDFARGHVVSVLDAAPERVEPPCPHVGKGCGGCGWQHVDPAAAGRLKERIALDALSRIGHVALDEVEVLAPAAVAPDGYRTTARLGVLEDGTLGYHRHRSDELVSIPSCGVAHPRLEELVGSVRVHGVAEVTLRVGVAGGERLVVLPEPGAAAGRERRRGRRPGAGPAGVASGEGAPVADIDVDAPPGVVVAGPGDKAWVWEEAGGRGWRVSARSFFQSGPAAAELLAHSVDAAAGEAGGGRLVDLYAGVGLLGGVVAARRDLDLVAVESSASAVADARSNLRDLGARVVWAEVGRWDPVPAELVIADPARPGLGRPGVAAVAATGAHRVVLVSCDPASLGRDAHLLAGAGYRVVALRVVDLFPRTPHVETVTSFELL